MVVGSKELGTNSFECKLILEYKNSAQNEFVDIDNLANNSKNWLDLVYKECIYSDKSVNKVSLFLSCLIDVDILFKEKIGLARIYLWASTAPKYKVHLETVYPLSKLLPAPSSNLDKVFVQIYPVLSDDEFSERYYDIENQRIDSEGFTELFEMIQEPSEKVIAITESTSIKRSKATKKPTPAQDIKVIKKSKVPQEVTATQLPIAKAKSNQNKFSTDNGLDLEIVDDVVWGIFSKQDLDDLVEGFKDWERVHGKNTLVARLPKGLADKIDDDFDVVFWTSGQGISNMVVDNRPPRHTMVMGLVKTAVNDIGHGIGYCIQRPTSLDKIWTHQKWHALECQNNDILKVTAVTF